MMHNFKIVKHLHTLYSVSNTYLFRDISLVASLNMLSVFTF